MRNLLPSPAQLRIHLIQQRPHKFLPIQERPRLLITLNVVLDLLPEFAVELLVLKDCQEAFVDFRI
jgi:hypothetical protein